jgi:hypothetical protein
MGKLGRQPINDAGKKPAPLAFTHSGEKRIEIRPNGIWDRFVDPTGNVVGVQLASRGVAAPVPAAAAMRLRHHNDGFVEHGKCPLKHGIRYVSPAIENDFAEMPDELQRPCTDDPVTMTKHPSGRNPDGSAKYRFEAHASCPHVEWLIKFRREREEELNAQRNAQRVAAEKREAEKRELETIQLEMAREELAARKAKAKDRKGPKDE